MESYVQTPYIHTYVLTAYVYLHHACNYIFIWWLDCLHWEIWDDPSVFPEQQLHRQSAVTCHCTHAALETQSCRFREGLTVISTWKQCVQTGLPPQSGVNIIHNIWTFTFLKTEVLNVTFRNIWPKDMYTLVTILVYSFLVNRFCMCQICNN